VAILVGLKRSSKYGHAEMSALQKHIVDDASELIATLGIATPLLNPTIIAAVDSEKREVAIFLRALLARHVVLVLTRLHAKAGAGQTGITASIDSYIEEERERGRLSDSDANIFLDRRTQIVKKMETQGVPYIDLYKFRNAEIAHSIQPNELLTNKLPSLAIWDLAYDTYELVFDLEKKLGSAVAELDGKFHLWLDRGRTFWPSENDTSSFELPE
jgi:hypothetical protein